MEGYGSICTVLIVAIYCLCKIWFNVPVAFTWPMVTEVSDVSTSSWDFFLVDLKEGPLSVLTI